LAVGGGVADLELLNGFLRGRYHGPDDEIDGIELGGALDDLLQRIAFGRLFLPILHDIRRICASNPGASLL